ncbi:hypothetical protein MKX01_002790 [Papaver californicum]|nr:hypothetical protein MKX01_002790 [Papaver californicum]
MDVIVEYLKCEKRKVEEEVDFSKRKFFVLQSECGIQKEQLDDYKMKYDALYVQFQEKSLDSYIVKGKLKDSTDDGVSTTENDELSKCMVTCDKLNTQIEEFKRRFHLEKNLKDYKTKYKKMYARFKENKEIGALLENDLNEYKRICKKDNKKAKKFDGRLCIDKLNKEITHLRRDKRSADDDTKILISKFGELESQTTWYLKELDDYKEKGMECLGYESKLKDLASITDVFQDEREGYKITLNGLKEQITGLAEDRKVLCFREKKAEEIIFWLQEVIKSLVEDNKKLTNDEGAAKCVQFIRETKMYSPHVNKDEHVSGSMSIENPSDPLVNLNGDKEKVSLLFNMELANTENKKIMLDKYFHYQFLYNIIHVLYPPTRYNS